jgi:hypothetical protein
VRWHKLHVRPQNQSLSFRLVIILIACSCVTQSFLVAKAQQSQPSLKESTDWLTQVFVDYGRNTSADGSEVSEWKLTSVSCQAVLVLTGSHLGRIYMTQRFEFSWGDLDPNHIQASLGGVWSPWFVLVTSDNSSWVHMTLVGNDGTQSSRDHRLQLLLNADSTYAPRVKTALKHTIELCGGKPSAF